LKFYFKLAIFLELLTVVRKYNLSFNVFPSILYLHVTSKTRTRPGVIPLTYNPNAQEGEIRRIAV
jgi:hypothetical protein